MAIISQSSFDDYKYNYNPDGHYTVEISNAGTIDVFNDNDEDSNYCSAIYEVNFGNTITCIPSASFFEAESLENVTMEDSVLSIGDMAFSGTNLRTFQFSNNLKYIGNNAFEWCYYLNNIRLPSSLSIIEKESFACVNFFGDTYTSVQLPLYIRHIKSGAFVNANIKNIEFPVTLSCIEDDAFLGNCMENVVLPENLKEIHNGSFALMNSLTSITIPEYVKIIGGNPFYGCKQLSASENFIFENVACLAEHEYGFVDMSNNDCLVIPFTKFDTLELTADNTPFSPFEIVNSIAAYAFYNDKNLKTIKCTKKLIDGIGDEAFSQCTNLSSVILHEDTRSIGHCAFLKCNITGAFSIPENQYLTTLSRTFAYNANLLSVTIPANISSLYNGVFDSCSHLNTVYMIGNYETAPIISCTSDILYDVGLFEDCPELTAIYVKDEATKTLFTNTECWAPYIDLLKIK